LGIDDAEGPPTKADVVAHLIDLITGVRTRRQVADWASTWVRAFAPDIPDERIRTALSCLAAADMISTDRPYLYDEDDFRDWLRELTAGVR
jgi:hypothetical protein